MGFSHSPMHNSTVSPENSNGRVRLGNIKNIWLLIQAIQEELEFKKNTTWSTTLGLWHVYLPVWERKRDEIVIYLHVCVFFIYDILEYVYHSACDKKFSVQLDPYLVQRKYIFRIYVSKLITTQSSSPYKVVLVSTSMVIVIVVLLIQHVNL